MLRHPSRVIGKCFDIQFEYAFWITFGVDFDFLAQTQSVNIKVHFYYSSKYSFASLSTFLPFFNFIDINGGKLSRSLYILKSREMRKYYQQKIKLKTIFISRKENTSN